MFIKFEYKYIDGVSYSFDSIDDRSPFHYIITDSDFSEDWEGYSIWHAIFDVYSKKQLNIYGNLAIAIKIFCTESKFTIKSMIDMFIDDENYSDLNVNINELEKYLILI